MDHLTRRLSSKIRKSSSSTNGSANGTLEAAEGGLVHHNHGHAPSQQSQEPSSQATTMRLRSQSSNNNNNNSTTTSSAIRRPGSSGRSRKRQRRRILSNGGSLGSVVTSTWDSIQHRTNRYLRRHPERLPWLVVSILITTLAVCLSTVMILHHRLAPTTQFGWTPLDLLFGRSQPLRRWGFTPFDIIFPRNAASAKPSKTFHTERGLAHDVTWIPPVLDGVDATNRMYVDYGGLKFTLFQEPGAVRQIGMDYKALQTHFRDYDTAGKDDDQDAYFALDDDLERNEFASRKSDGHPEGLRCRRVHEHRFSFPNCNTFHETALLEWGVTYLGEGSYRQVVGLEHDLGDEIELIALKDYHYTLDFTLEGYEYVRMDATVAERLTSSPRIYDIYGFCGLGIMSEWFEHGDIEPLVVPGDGYLNVEERKMEQEIPLKPHNDFTPFQKLQMSLQMAEGLADLHGNANGVIVHQDVQLSQFLFNSDKSILKLNDFNRAEFMLWNDEKQEYCKYTEFAGHGNWRSPEEYFDNPLNEQVDVFSVGNNMYSLLTGLWVFYDEKRTSAVQKRVKKGEMAYIDPRYKERSVEEAKLAEAINWCHQYLPEDRPSIFQLVDFLRKAVEEASKGLDKRQ